MVRGNICVHLFFLLYMCTLFNGIECRRGWRSKCPRIDIPNGRVRLRGTSGLMLRIKCNSFFHMIDGDRRLTCIRNQWVGRIGICIRRGCPEISIKNGETLGFHDEALQHINCKHGYKLEGPSTIYCDGENWNTTIPRCLVPLSDPEHLSCTFERPTLCGWTQDLADNFDFKWISASNVFHGGLGAKVDHTFETRAGHFIYTDSQESWNRLRTARLFSPFLPAPEHAVQCVIVWYHMYGPNTATLSIYIKPESLPVEIMNSAFSTKPGFHPDEWQLIFLNLEEDLDEQFQVILEVRGGSGLNTDVAIDDFKYTHGKECIDIEIELESKKSKENKSSTTASSTSKANAVTTAITTSTQVILKSCEGICGNKTNDSVCGCTENCLDFDNCCHDYLTICPQKDDSTSKAATIMESSKYTLTSAFNETVVSTTTSVYKNNVTVPIVKFESTKSPWHVTEKKTTELATSYVLPSQRTSENIQQTSQTSPQKSTTMNPLVFTDKWNSLQQQRTSEKASMSGAIILILIGFAGVGALAAVIVVRRRKINKGNGNSSDREKLDQEGENESIRESEIDDRDSSYTMSYKPLQDSQLADDGTPV